MVKDSTNNRVRVLIKSFLCANKGKKLSAREIANFINTYNFGLNRHQVTPEKVTRMIQADYNSSSILHEIQRERKNGRYAWRYWM